MDFQLQNLLRRFLLSKDPADAVLFTNAYIKTQGDPNQITDQFYQAWWWLHYHPAFFRQYDGLTEGDEKEGFFTGLDISVQKVNPLTGYIDDNKTLNTQVEFWLENGPWERVADHLDEDIYGNGEMPSHDFNLDCGGLSYEQAILEMAKLVKKHYGDYKSDPER